MQHTSRRSTNLPRSPSANAALRNTRKENVLTPLIQRDGRDVIEHVHNDKVISRYYRGRYLGKGGFAICHEVQSAKSGCIYAAKIIDKKTLKKPKTQQKLFSEIKIHQEMNHKHIVNFEKFFEDSKFVYILLELCHCQSMMELMNVKKILSEQEAQYFLYQILTAVKYMHDNRVIHRDLKLGNLFLDKNMNVKIGDFGLATKLETDEERKRTICGTPNYIAPEILQNHDNGHSYEVDIWSIGVMLYTFLIGIPPFETSTVKDTYEKIRLNSYTFPTNGPQISSSAKALIKKMLHPDPSMRPDVDEILKDNFMFDYQHDRGELLYQCPPSLMRYAEPINPSQVLSKAYSRMQKKTQIETPSVAESIKRFPLRDIANRLVTCLTGSTASPSSQPVVSKYSVDKHINYQSSKMNEHDLDYVATSKRRPNNHVEPLTERNRQKQSNFLTSSVTIGAKRPLQYVHTSSTRKKLSNARENSERREALIESAKTIIPKREQEIWSQDHAKHRVALFSENKSYGLAYRLINSDTGVVFNDDTCMLGNTKTTLVQYLESAEQGMHPYDIDNAPSQLNKKVTLFKYFDNVLTEFSNRESISYMDSEYSRVIYEHNQDKVYVKSYRVTGNGYFFLLSNKTVQMSFKDNTQIILGGDGMYVSYVDRSHKLQTFTKESGAQNEEEEVKKKYTYTKDVLARILKERF
ncbi:polo-like protein kinase PLK1 [Acrasis kona]|uniref:Serine/threonine-protein kinase PLK n=1 Tax=Acrasis kona TaxID=1008807 RepID=A0AAW2YJ97_9EUKA